MPLFFWFDLSVLARAEILKIFCSYFGRNDDFINLFWDLLTFSKLTRIFVNFRVIFDLFSLIIFYWITLDQISHTWFDWNIVNVLKHIGKMKKNVSKMVFAYFFYQFCYATFMYLPWRKNEHFLLHGTDSKSKCKFISCKDA